MHRDEAEQQALEALNGVHDTILGWGLKGNHDELAAAVHVIQGFIIQRMLQRHDPEAWGDWYAERPG